jgi:hypothetical protein
MWLTLSYNNQPKIYPTKLDPTQISFHFRSGVGSRRGEEEKNSWLKKFHSSGWNGFTPVPAFPKRLNKTEMISLPFQNLINAQSY